MPGARLCVHCDLVTPEEHRAQVEAMGLTPDGIRDELAYRADTASFTVRRVVVLEDGTALHWGDEGGFTTGICDSGDVLDVWAVIGTTQLTHAARTAFAGTIADHRRLEVDLAEFLRAHGVDESSSGILAQPADVVFSDRLIARLDQSDRGWRED